MYPPIHVCNIMIRGRLIVCSLNFRIFVRRARQKRLSTVFGEAMSRVARNARQVYRAEAVRHKSRRGVFVFPFIFLRLPDRLCVHCNRLIRICKYDTLPKFGGQHHAKLCKVNKKPPIFRAVIKIRNFFRNFLMKCTSCLKCCRAAPRNLK